MRKIFRWIVVSILRLFGLFNPSADLRDRYLAMKKEVGAEEMQTCCTLAGRELGEEWVFNMQVVMERALQIARQRKFKREYSA